MAKSRRQARPREGPKRGRGRPSAFKPEFVRQAEELTKLGATDGQIARFFQVTIATVTNWKHAHPDFLASLTRGKELCDDIIEKSLFQRASGYTYDAVKIFMPAGASAPVYAPYVEHVPPDPTSMIFWLKNRRRLEWRDTRPGDQADEDGVMKVKIVNDPDSSSS